MNISSITEVARQPLRLLALPGHLLFLSCCLGCCRSSPLGGEDTGHCSGGRGIFPLCRRWGRWWDGADSGSAGARLAAVLHLVLGLVRTSPHPHPHHVATQKVQWQLALWSSHRAGQCGQLLFLFRLLLAGQNFLENAVNPLIPCDGVHWLLPVGKKKIEDAVDALTG